MKAKPEWVPDIFYDRYLEFKNNNSAKISTGIFHYKISELNQDTRKQPVQYYERLIYGEGMHWGWKEVSKRITLKAEEFEKECDDDLSPGDYKKGQLAKNHVESHFRTLLMQLEKVALISENDISSRLEYIDARSSRRVAYEKIERNAKSLSRSLKPVEQYDDAEFGINLDRDEKKDVDNNINSSRWFNKKLDSILFDAHREVVKAVCDFGEVDIDLEMQKAGNTAKTISNIFERVIREDVLKIITGAFLSEYSNVVKASEAVEKIQYGATDAIWMMRSHDKLPIKRGSEKDRWRILVIDFIAHCFVTQFNATLNGTLARFASAVLNEVVTKEQVREVLRNNESINNRLRTKGRGK